MTQAQAAALLEGYHTITATERDEDCDYGPCTGFTIAELGITIFIYDNDPERVSIHVE